MLATLTGLTATCNIWKGNGPTSADSSPGIGMVTGMEMSDHCIPTNSEKMSITLMLYTSHFLSWKLATQHDQWRKVQVRQNGSGVFGVLIQNVLQEAAPLS